jgi:hypothetical protein
VVVTAFLYVFWFPLFTGISDDFFEGKIRVEGGVSEVLSYTKMAYIGHFLESSVSIDLASIPR